jgi:hypothetical protein
MEENLTYEQLLATKQAPYLNAIRSKCGSETNFHAATHPSQPNYMAATSGIPSPLGVKVGNDNIFSQLQNSGRGQTWKSYQESMPGPCSQTNTGIYKPGHNAAYYYTKLRTPINTCSRNDVPLTPALANDLAADTLPTYAWITPNECHVFYWTSSCSTPSANRIAEGDKWLSQLLPKLLALRSYAAGQTLILLTFDEGIGPTEKNGVDCTAPSYYSSHPDCHIPTVVVSPYVKPGATDKADHNLYSLLGTTEDILGLPRLANAKGRPSLRAGLRF